ncbi:MAG: ribonuclease PH [Alphaproteobacteria bacterium]|nr:ribonuclease PH [Alphaproteobacteria bacterium SS10]
MTSTSRPSGREANAMRAIEIETDVSIHAEGSCLIKFGHTHVLCTASVEDGVPGWMRNSGRGWVTAEYGMLPRSTGSRTGREAARGKQSGRTQEIQRLIGRALRSIIDLEKLGEIQIKIDCDVIQADGGTRTAAITGGYVALHLALQHLLAIKAIDAIPLTDSVAAVSCGVYGDMPVLDLDYAEDSNAVVDANFVLTGSGGIVEIQGTGEERPFSRDEFNALMGLAEQGCTELAALQTQALKR